MWPQSICPSHMAMKHEILAQIKNSEVTPGSASPIRALPAPKPLCFSCTVFVVCLHPTPYISWCVILKEAKASLSLLFTPSSSGSASMRSLHCTPADETYSAEEVHWQWSTTEFSVGVGALLMAFSFKIVISPWARPDFPPEDFMNCCTSLQFLKSRDGQSSSFLKAYTNSPDVVVAAMDGWVLHRWIDTILLTLDLYLTNLRSTYTSCLLKKYNLFILFIFKGILELNISF